MRRLAPRWQITTCKKLSVIPASSLPKNWDQYADTVWAISVALNIAFTVWKWRRLDKQAPSRAHTLMLLSLLKYCCDLGQALPSAAKWDSPPALDSTFGLTSGLLATYKIWLEGAK